MPDWLLHTGFETQVNAALWSTLAAALTTVVLFVYTLGLRAAMVMASHRRARLVEQWRKIFALAMASRDAAQTVPLPRFSRHQWTDLLEEMNGMREAVDGGAADNIIVLANRIGFFEIARRLVTRHRLRSKILGLQTLGHLRDGASWQAIEDLLHNENAALSITAAGALINIDASRAVKLIVPMMTERKDWPRTRLFAILRSAGAERLNEPLTRAIRAASAADQVDLLKFTPLGDFSVMDGLIVELIRESDDPHVLAVALKRVSGHAGTPRMALLTQHKEFYVRMRVAELLGRVGQREHMPLLAALLEDSEWWVRYRAAQAIVKLPFLGPNAVRQLRGQTTDRYARDILDQAMAEVGLA